ncbi:radical SAM protein [bacterium]|nr:radical SAM protein [bacterium]
MVIDSTGRSFNSLRVSLTGECNLACTYCVPEKRCIKEPAYEMTSEELIRMITWLKEILNLEKIRLTGGEPLISPKFNNVLSAVSKMQFKDVSITTNGQLLEENLSFILSCGVKRINVSLDTLDADKFLKNTRGGDLKRTMTGIEKAKENQVFVKVNMVPVKHFNEDEIIPILDYCLDKGFELRYIELMQMGHLSDREKYLKKLIPIDTVFSIIRQKYIFEPVASAADSTSFRYKIKGKGYFGVIANDSIPFCRGCNRLRLTSTGNIHGCLSSEVNYSILSLLNLQEAEAKTELISILNQAILTKRELAFNGSSTVMKQVGG